MRTTIKIDDDLLREAKEIAVKSGRGLADVIGDAVRESFARRRKAASSAEPLRLPTYGRSGLRPGVDLDDSSALLDVMEGHGS